MAGQATDITAGDEAGKLGFVVNVDGAEQDMFIINGYNGSVVGQAEIIVNEPGLDSDFRVESNDQTHMLFVDGRVNKVGIGTNAPAGALHIESAGNIDSNPQLLLKSTASDTHGAGIKLDSTNLGGGAIWKIHNAAGGAGEPSGSLIFYNYTSASYDMAMSPTGNVGIGTHTPLNPLHVETTATSGWTINVAGHSYDAGNWSGIAFGING